MRTSPTARACFIAALAAASTGAAGRTYAQGYDPAVPGSSPIVLLSAPADPLAYYETRQRARALILANNAAEAEPLAEWLVRAYPSDGENWMLLASARRRLGRHAEAAAAYERAGELSGWAYASRLGGKNAERPGFYAIASHLAAGNRAAALALLKVEVRRPGRLGYVFEPEFAALRDDPEFLAIMNLPDPKGVSRDEGWLMDVDFLYSEVARVHPDFQGQPLPARFTQAYHALRSNVPRLSDEQMFVELNRMLATLNPYGHTELNGLGNAAGVIKPAELPLRLYAFQDGVFVINATAQHRDLIGARVVQVERTAIDEALRLASTLISRDAYIEYAGRAPSYLTSVPLLRGLGIAGASDTVRMTFERDGRGETRAFMPLPRRPWDETPTPANLNAPLNVDPRQGSRTLRAMPAHGAYYVKLDVLLDQPDETLAAFGSRLWQVLDSVKPRNVILDLRVNGGGSTHLYGEVLRTLIAFTRIPGNQLYVLIGRRTYSAAGNLVTDLDRLAEPLFVGESSGQCCTLHGDPEGVTLPWSRISGSITATRWRLTHPWDERLGMSPDLPVHLTSTDYFAGRDPALEAVYAMIAKGTASR